MLKNYLRAYAQLKADPRHKKAVLVFKNRKDGEDWIVEPTGFTMVRSASNPFLYTYNITLRALKRTFALPGLDDSDSLGAFGQFLGQLENAETVLTGSIDLINTGAGIITQALDYVVQIEQSFETLIMSPIHAVTNVLQAVQNGVNRVSALPRKFYTDLQANITVLERSLEDRTNLGSSTYNARMGRISTANPAADREATPEELLIFKGLNYVQRGLTIATATNLIFSTETSDPTVSSVDAFNTSNSIILSSNDKIKLKKTTLEGIQRLFNNELILTIPNSAIVTTIRYGETLEEIAMRTLGDVSRWYDIVAINQLKHPYIEETADFGAKTLGYGDKIYIPSSSPITKYNIIKGRETYITENMSEVEKSMGVDLEINLDGDLRINARQDIDLVAGAANAAQAIHLALSIEQGALKYHLYKGVSLQPGFKDSSKIDEIMDNIKSSILSDPRFERITDMSLVRDGPMILIDMRVQVTNIGRTIPLQISL